MSWLRNALNKASEVAGAAADSASNPKSPVLNASATGNFLAGRMRQYAGAVVQRAGDAMAGGAKLVMERAATGKNLNNLKHAIRRLDEVSRTARGKERTEALTRWLGALRELGKAGKLTDVALEKTTSDIPPAESTTRQEPPAVTSLEPSDLQATGTESIGEDIKSPSATPESSASSASSAQGLVLLGSQSSIEGSTDSASTTSSVAASVLFYDVESGDDPFTFRDVFLRSNALENIVVTLVKEAPTEHDEKLVLELLDLCMMGSHDTHASFLKAVVTLSPVFASYSEVKLSQQELLQMVATAVTGMKYNSEAERLETIASKLTRELDSLDASESSSGPESFSLSLKLADATRQLESLVAHQGDDAAQRTAKIESAKGLSSDLLDKLSDFELRIKECKQQLQDSEKFRGAKAEEVLSSEQVISEELRVLHKRRVKLEEELEQVMSAIGAATRRHLEIQEEKEQFDLVSSSIASRLTVEEEGLHVMMRQHAEDAKVLGEWGRFLEGTWEMQQGSREGGEREAREAEAEARVRLWKAASQHLEELRDDVTRCWEHFKTEKAKVEELGLFGSPAASREASPRGLPADEGYRVAEFRLKNALREIEKGKAEVAVRTSAMADPGEGPSKEHFTGIQQVIAQVDEIRREYSSLPRLRSSSKGFVPVEQAKTPESA